MKENLNKQELELLCQAYLNSRLTRLEEQELALVLLSTTENFGSEIIEEVRQMLAFETACAASRPKKKVGRRIWTAAASLAALLAFGIWLAGHPASESEQHLANADKQEAKQSERTEDATHNGLAEATTTFEETEDLQLIARVKEKPAIKETASRSTKPKEHPQPPKTGQEETAEKRTDLPDLLQETEQHATPNLTPASFNTQAYNPPPADFQPQNNTTIHYRTITADDVLDLQLLLLDRQVQAIEAVGNRLLDNNERLVNCLYVSEEIIY